MFWTTIKKRNFRKVGSNGKIMEKTDLERESYKVFYELLDPSFTCTGKALTPKNMTVTLRTAHTAHTQNKPQNDIHAGQIF